jgi:NAD kinase
MKLDNVLISTKQTDLEYARMNYDDVIKEYGAEQYERMVKSNIEHYNALNLIRDTLNSKGINNQRIYMPYTAHEEFKNRDLVICVGGDGTVLNTARYILDNTPVLTVKSESSSIGALCNINTSQFEDKLNQILKDDYSIEQKNRIEGMLDNKVDIALNDISILPYYAAGFVRYEVNFHGIKELISGSGMVISTGSGATGWYRKIGGADQEFSPKDPFLRFIAREYDYAENDLLPTLKGWGIYASA